MGVRNTDREFSGLTEIHNRKLLAADASQHPVRRVRSPQPKDGPLLCLVENCEQSALRQDHGRSGYCTSHYQRLSRHGDAFAGLTVRGEAWAYANRIAQTTDQETCVLWPYMRDPSGHGRVRIGGRGTATIAVHRLICELAHGPAPTSRHIAVHSCRRGQSGCCNPTHLRWATYDEAHDEIYSCRTILKGESHPRSKLSEQNVREILNRLGVVTKYRLAKEYGVTPAAITAIQKGKTWKCIERTG